MKIKIEIEIAEKTAALLFANAWGGRGGAGTLSEIVTCLAEDAAVEYLRAFPGTVQKALSEFRAAFVA